MDLRGIPSMQHAGKYAAVACLGSLSRTALAEPFMGQFELKTLEAAPGAIEFQSQNAWASGQPQRAYERIAENEVAYDENSLFRRRHALEVEIGLSDAFKMRVGIEAENERVDEPASLLQANEFEGLQIEEIGAELVAVLIPCEENGFGMGVVVELEGPLELDGPNHLILGPIIEVQVRDWLFAAVPMFVRPFGGDTQNDDKWDFSYAAQLMKTISDRWSFAIEGYGTIERLGDSGNPSSSAAYFGDSDQHRLGPVVYFGHTFAASDSAMTRSDSGVAIGVGVLRGLSSHTADATMKLSIEIDF